MATKSSANRKPKTAPSPAPRDRPQVLWLLDARRHVRIALARELAAGSCGGSDEGATASADSPIVDAPFFRHLEGAEKVLRQTFHQASQILVRNRLQGFRINTMIDILLVEVFPAPRITPFLGESKSQSEPGPEAGDRAARERRERADSCTFIVKILNPAEDGKRKEEERRGGGGNKLASEINAWRGCRPEGFYDDSILAPLMEGHTGEKGELRSIIYADVHSVLATGEIKSLEDAFLECVLFGSPTVASFNAGINRMFARLESRFYERSYICPGSELAKKSELSRRLGEARPEWRESADAPGMDSGKPAIGLSAAERLRFRRESLGLLASESGTFIDPSDFLEDLAPRPLEWPRLVCGCSHGDLHGRNITVSVIDGRVGSFALFDYEDMRRDNLLAWDFVKLEVELKVRAYKEIFKGGRIGFVQSVHRFEVALAEWTEALHDSARIDHIEFPGGEQGERLARVLCFIRGRARKHIGSLRLRQREWLEEFYFVLLCYGIYAVKFTAYLQEELVAAYISSGVAARRLDRPYGCMRTQIEEAEKSGKARAAIRARGDNGERIDIKEMKACWDEETGGKMSYHAGLEFARQFSRPEKGKIETVVRRSIPLLRALRRQFPHAVEIDEELALVYLELKDETEAKKILASIERRYRIRSEESLCRFGRERKNRAVEVIPKGRDDELGSDAPRFLRQALGYYREAMRIRHNYYPAINVASLHWLLGERTESGAVARAILRAAGGGEHGPEEQEKAGEELVAPLGEEAASAWGQATRAEAHFLLSRHKDAEDLYRKAVGPGHRMKPRDKESMRRQVELLRIADKEARAFWTKEKLDEIFGKRVEKA